ncbi:MAG: CHASE2 domain-containing protein [Pseudomonadota bacterium]
MFEQRQEQRLRLLLSAPAVIILALAAFAMLTAKDPGRFPREGFFDLILRLAPRPAAEAPSTATILIDDESAERLGPWPWPRSAYAGLIDAAEAAGAQSVTLTISVAGEDPLSPDVLVRRWLNDSAIASTGDPLAALALLPSNDLILARAIAGGRVGIGVADRLRSADRPVRWGRVSEDRPPWLRIADQTQAIALPAVIGTQTLTTEIEESTQAVVAGLPQDPDGVVRRSAPLYAVGDRPAPAAGLAALAIAGQPVGLDLSRHAISARGRAPVSITVGDHPSLPLDNRGEVRLWLPQAINVQAVPAWRVYDDPQTWTRPFKGKHVFIGETQSDLGTQRTARGVLPTAEIHALYTEQILQGAAPRRVNWAGFTEGFATLLVGTAAVLAVIFLPAILASTLTIGLILISFAVPFFLFRQTGMLFDPTPGVMAAAFGPLAVGATMLTNMVVRDDALRGAFHGALPQKAMRRVQSQGGQKLLKGVHRDVTVLSCSFELPPKLIERFAGRPRDFMLFRASANDRLRRTILEHEGTVDYGEDGRRLGYWNVPLAEDKHIELACSCALRMLDDVSSMSQQVSESHHVSRGGALKELADGRIEIGISTGPCFAGPAGLGGRNRYAALGEPVRFAGRLRGRSALYGPAIITDANVFDTLRHHYAFLDLDYVRQHPEAQAETIYGLVGNPFLKASKTFRQLADIQRDLLSAWRAQDIKTAMRHLQQLRGIPGVPQTYVELFEKRLLAARVSSPRQTQDVSEVLSL